jgi:hypothetical protein
MESMLMQMHMESMRVQTHMESMQTHMESKQAQMHKDLEALAKDMEMTRGSMDYLVQNESKALAATITEPLLKRWWTVQSKQKSTQQPLACSMQEGVEAAAVTTQVQAFLDTLPAEYLVMYPTVASFMAAADANFDSACGKPPPAPTPPIHPCCAGRTAHHLHPVRARPCPRPRGSPIHQHPHQMHHMLRGLRHSHLGCGTANWAAAQPIGLRHSHLGCGTANWAAAQPLTRAPLLAGALWLDASSAEGRSRLEAQVLRFKKATQSRAFKTLQATVPFAYVVLAHFDEARTHLWHGL